ncbi:hypothetical protein HBI80_075120 [Parastagonospora nodorum]|nr:hypothetical protein HBI80_075120 [Parastagonospora nodorum]
MLFRCSIVVVVFALGIRDRRLKSESKYLLSIMLRRSYVGSKGLVSLEQCSTVPYCPYLLLRVLGARY